MVKTKCEVYSRVVGYIRPVSNWNDSKQAEFSDRVKFDELGTSSEASLYLGRKKSGSEVTETCKC